MRSLIHLYLLQRFLATVFINRDFVKWFKLFGSAFFLGEIQSGNDDNNNYISSGTVLVEPLSFISVKLVLIGIGKSRPPTHSHCVHMRDSTSVSLLSSLICLHTKLLRTINKRRHENQTNSSLVCILQWHSRWFVTYTCTIGKTYNSLEEERIRKQRNILENLKYSRVKIPFLFCKAR